MDDKTVQKSLTALGYYDGEINGLYDEKTMQAVVGCLTADFANSQIDWQSWPRDRQILACKQVILREMGIDAGAVDGLMGPQTRAAIQEWQSMVRGTEGIPEQSPPKAIVWPTQAQVPSFYGPPGQNQVMLELPYQMRIAWDLKNTVNKISCHAKVADSMGRVLAAVLAQYGLAEVQRLHLDYFGGCLNVRRMRGSNAMSMHSWGIAIDIDPDRNEMHMGRDRAQMAKPEYEPWFQAWEAEGWVSLGRARNFDWMHVQAARL